MVCIKKVAIERDKSLMAKVMTAFDRSESIPEFLIGRG